MMLAWVIVAAMYVLGACQMAVLAHEWNYKFTPRPVAVIVLWPVVAAIAFIGAMILGSGFSDFHEGRFFRSPPHYGFSHTRKP